MIEPRTENKKVIEMPECSADKKAKLLADIYASPSMNAAHMLLEFNPKSSLALMPLMEILKDQAVAIRKGDIDRIAEMLVTQTYALQSIFTKCAL